MQIIDSGTVLGMTLIFNLLKLNDRYSRLNSDFFAYLLNANKKKNKKK